MKFGLPLFGVSPRYYPDVARIAEGNGFESIWLPEHLVLPEPIPPTYLYSDDGYPPITSATPVYDPWVMLGGIATVTSTLRLATQVYILPLRHPIVTARAVVSLDRLSGGRVTLGMGVGWCEEEFEAVDQSFRNRGRRADEIIGILRRLWSDEVIEHRGRYYSFGPVRFEPKPLQKPGIPIEVGGTSPGALRRAGTLGDGWVETGEPDIAALAAKLEIINRHREEAGRSGLPFEVTSGLGRDLDGIRRCQEAGVTRVIAGPPARDARLTVEEISDWAKRFSDEVIGGL